MSETWPLVALGDLCEIRSGYAFKSSTWAQSGIPVLQIGNISDGYIDISSLKYVSDKTAAAAAKFSTHEGDVLVAMTGYVGAVAKISTRETGFLVNQRVGRIENLDTSKVSGAFLYWALRLPASKSAMVNLANGSAQPNLAAKDFAKIEIPLPPLAEQRRIAGVLGALDDLIETNEGLVRDLRKLVGAVLASRQSAHATTVVPLGDVFTFKEGQTSKPASRVTTGGVPIMGANGVIGSSSTANSSQSTVVLGKIGSAGALNVTSGPSWITNNAFEVLPREPWSRELVLALLQQVDFTSCIGGSANPYMPLKNFEHVRITLPSDIGQIASLARTSESAIDELGSEFKELKSTRDELLPLFMSGRVRVKDVAA